MTALFDGLVPATHTPFHADGSFAPEVVPLQAQHLIRQGVRTVFVAGSTGEGHSLTRDERRALFEAWAPQPLRVVAHVGSNCLEDAKWLASAAQDLGLAAVSALSPSYYKPADVEALVEWCSAIAAAAPRLPFTYYDIPVMTGVDLPTVEVAQRAAERIPNFAGVKFTKDDLDLYARCLALEGGRLAVPWGIDERLLDALDAGARGAVGSTYNFAAPLYHALMQARERGDQAAAHAAQLRAVEGIRALASVGYLGAAKALMTWQGVPVGPARQPLRNPTARELEPVRARLAELGWTVEA